MPGDDFTTTRDSDASAMRSPGENDRQRPTAASASDDSAQAPTDSGASAKNAVLLKSRVAGQNSGGRRAVAATPRHADDDWGAS